MQERNSKQEEALFTLLMDQVARQENQQAREAMERLARDPSAAVPALSQRRCMQTIQRGLRAGICAPPDGCCGGWRAGQR